MKKYNIVKKKYEFDKIIKNDKFYKNNCYIIYYMNSEIGNYRFGISVGKKLGNAVFRNKYKRIIRSIIDNNKKYYQKNMDYIIIMRKGSINVPYSSMESAFLELIEMINKRRT